MLTTYILTVDDTFWFSEKWHKVNEINDEELADLTLSVNSRRAFLKGAELLSRRAHGKAELVRKLTQKYPRECAEQAADKLEKLGLINDGEFAICWRRSFIRTANTVSAVSNRSF